MIDMDRLVAIAAVALQECDRQARAMREEEVERPDPLCGRSLREQRLYLQHLQREDLRTADDRHYDAEQAYIQLQRRREGLDHDKDWSYKIRPLNPYNP